MKNKHIKIISLIAAFSLALCGCGDIAETVSDRGSQQTAATSAASTSATSKSTEPAAEDTSSSAPETEEETEASPDNGGLSAPVNNRGTMLSVNEGGGLQISRLGKKGGSAGSDGIWTVFVYMCGSDLETDQGSATDDMLEMQDATKKCSSLRFVVEADGAEKWWNDMCEDGKKQRLLISDGYCDVVYSGASTNMGDPGTLSDFLSWGLSEYSSEFTVLDLWDHGGGSISGVCFDELHGDDSLTLKEIDGALASVYGKMDKPFELAGCDACLMAAVELANVLAPYANYMVASQDLESGYGWDYNAFADAVNDYGEQAKGSIVGEYICDGYYASCVLSGEEKEATLSVVDLSKLDAFLTEFNLLCADIYDYIQIDEGVTEIIKAAKNSLNFGGNNRSEGYTNMVDLRDFIGCTGTYSGRADSAGRLLDDCIVYMVNGENSSYAGGLNVYYPLCVQGSNELADFKEVCVSPYYISIADICAYGSDSMGSIDGYDAESWLGEDSGFWSGEELDISGYGYWEYSEETGLNSDAGNTALQYAVEPNIDGDGSYNFTLTEDSLYDLDTVYCNIMMSYWDEEDNREYMLDLGTDDYVDLDWDTGVCRDLFDGIWFALPDGQPICAFLVECSYEPDAFYNLYTAPVYLNGEYTNLRIMQDYSSDTAVTTVLGAWDGISESGSAARDLYKIQAGDVIEPCYYAYDAETLEYAFDFYGAEYVCDGDLTVDYDYLYDGDYYYAFEIYDLYGNALYTDFVLFGIEGCEDGTVDLFYY